MPHARHPSVLHRRPVGRAAERPNDFDVINPATEEADRDISLGSAADVDDAVAAARRAFASFSQTTREERIALLERIIGVYQQHYDEIAETISREMGAPLWLSQGRAGRRAVGAPHAPSSRCCSTYEFERERGTTLHRARADRRLRLHHAVELAGQPDHLQGRAGARRRLHDGAEAERDRAAQRASCSPRSCTRPACPTGVFNLVNGDGPTVGAALSSHPGIDMMSFTGSTRAGIAVAKAAADTVKRVAQELGGKSANIILDDADLAKARRAAACAAASSTAASPATRRRACSCRARSTTRRWRSPRPRPSR